MASICQNLYFTFILKDMFYICVCLIVCIYFSDVMSTILIDAALFIMFLFLKLFLRFLPLPLPLGVHWEPCNYGFIVFTKYWKILGIIASNIFSAFPFFPGTPNSWLLECLMFSHTSLGINSFFFFFSLLKNNCFNLNGFYFYIFRLLFFLM